MYIKKIFINTIKILLCLFLIISVIHIYNYFQKLDTSTLIIPNKIELIKINNNDDISDDSKCELYKTIDSQSTITDLYKNINETVLRKNTHNISYPIYFFTANYKNGIALIYFNKQGDLIIYDSLICGKKFKGKLNQKIVDELLSK